MASGEEAHGETASGGPTADALTDDALTATFRVFQRRRGHRYSLDDVLTADEAVCAAPRARSAVDLGCGIGSVALMLAWRLPAAAVTGVEAQQISHRLAARNVARNGAEEQVRLIHADLRHLDEGTLGDADLVTGTPPYFPPGSATPSTDPQRAYARVELRGGVEDYLRVAGETVASGGAVVICIASQASARVLPAADAAGLRPHRRLIALPREGRPPLFEVWTLRRSPGRCAEERFIARGLDGARTEAYHALRERFGLTRPVGEPPSP